MISAALIFTAVLNVLQAKRKRARTPTPGEYLGVRGMYLPTSMRLFESLILFMGHEMLQMVGCTSLQFFLMFDALYRL
jgi:hypothetical protein